MFTWIYKTLTIHTPLRVAFGCSKRMEWKEWLILNKNNTKECEKSNWETSNSNSRKEKENDYSSTISSRIVHIIGMVKWSMWWHIVIGSGVLWTTRHIRLLYVQRLENVDRSAKVLLCVCACVCAKLLLWFNLSALREFRWMRINYLSVRSCLLAGPSFQFLFLFRFWRLLAKVVRQTCHTSSMWLLIVYGQRFFSFRCLFSSFIQCFGRCAFILAVFRISIVKIVFNSLSLNMQCDPTEMTLNDIIMLKRRNCKWCEFFAVEKETFIWCVFWIMEALTHTWPLGWVIECKLTKSSR